MENKTLTNCKACGEEIAKSAKTCPKCGAKVKKPFYKKKIFYILIILVVLTAALVFYINHKKTDYAEIGQTYTSSYGIEFTVNYIKFADAIDNWGGANDTYWQPVDEAIAAHGGVDRNIKENAVKPKSEKDTILIVSYTAKNASKYDRTIDDRGTLNYDNGYEYTEGGLTYRVNSEGIWKDIDGGLTTEKLKDDGHEYRVYMVVPKEVVKNKDKSLTYTLYGKTFDLRQTD